MAREGIANIDEGLGEFLQALHVHFDRPELQEQRNLAQYMERKARAKARRYNVRMKDDDKE
ncbi:MAG: hypothetical protein ACREO1_08505 [Arenimonas sp.]